MAILLVQIDAAIRKAVSNGDIPESAFADLEDLLVGKAKGGRIASKAQLAFDVSEIARMRPRVLIPGSTSGLSDRLHRA